MPPTCVSGLGLQAQRIIRTWLFGLGFLALAGPLPAEASEKIAVLEFSGADEMALAIELSDALRYGVRRATAGTDYTVMTRESMDEWDHDNDDVDLADCDDASSCEIALGRALEAAYVLSANVNSLSDANGLPDGFIVNVKFLGTGHDVPLLAGDMVMGKSEDELLSKLGAFGEKITREALDIHEPESLVRFESRPVGAAVEVDGQEVCSSTPCSLSLSHGRHRVEMRRAEHHPAQEEVTISGPRTVNLELRPSFGLLNVETVPPGLEVEIDRVLAGNSPLLEHHLSPGTHEIRASDGCYRSKAQRVQVREAETRDVKIEAQERQGRVTIAVRNARGEAIVADIVVGDRTIGQSPGRFEIPLCSEEISITAPGYLPTTIAPNLSETTEKKLRIELVSEPLVVQEPGGTEAPGEEEQTYTLPAWAEHLIENNPLFKSCLDERRESSGGAGAEGSWTQSEVEACAKSALGGLPLPNWGVRSGVQPEGN